MNDYNTTTAEQDNNGFVERQLASALKPEEQSLETTETVPELEEFEFDQDDIDALRNEAKADPKAEEMYRIIDINSPQKEKSSLENTSSTDGQKKDGSSAAMNNNEATKEDQPEIAKKRSKRKKHRSEAVENQTGDMGSPDINPVTDKNVIPTEKDADAHRGLSEAHRERITKDGHSTANDDTKGRHEADRGQESRTDVSHNIVNENKGQKFMPKEEATNISNDSSPFANGGQKSAQEDAHIDPVAKNKSAVQGEIAISTDIENGTMYSMSEAASLLDKSTDLIQAALNEYPTGLSSYTWGISPMFTLADIRILESYLDTKEAGISPKAPGKSIYEIGAESSNPIFTGERKNMQDATPAEHIGKKEERTPALPSFTHEELKGLIKECIEEVIDEKSNLTNDTSNEQFRKVTEAYAAQSADIKKTYDKLSGQINEKMASLAGTVAKSGNDTRSAVSELAENIKESIKNADDKNGPNTKELENMVKKAVNDSVLEAIKPLYDSQQVSDREAYDMAPIIKEIEKLAEQVKTMQENVSDIKNSVIENTAIDLSPIEKNTDKCFSAISQIESKIDTLSVRIDNGLENAENETGLNEIKDGINAIKDAIRNENDTKDNEWKNEVMDYLNQILERVLVDPTATTEYLDVSSKLQTADDEIKRREKAVINIAKELEEQKHIAEDLRQEVEILKSDKESLENALIRSSTEIPSSSATYESRQNNAESDTEEYEEYIDEEEADSLDTDKRRSKENKTGKHKRGLFSRK